MKFAFALIPEKGHINPYIGPAQALVEMGHEVVIAAPGDISSQIERAGLTFRDDLVPPPPTERINSGAALVELIQNPARLDQWIEELLLDRLSDSVPRVEAWLAREYPDALVVDPLFYPAGIASQRLRIPWAAVSNSLNPVVAPEFDSALARTIKRLSPRRAGLFAKFGFPGAQFAVADVLSPRLTIVFATAEFVGEPPPGITLAGPSLPIYGRGDDVRVKPLPSDKPILYVSFGSQIYHWPGLLDKILAAAAQLNIHAVCAMGALANDPRWRNRCDAYCYAPQLEILKRANIFVTHGGANSVMEALAAQVPMLVSPMCNDQFHQAHFISQARCGLVLDLIHASQDDIASALHTLLNDEALRARAAGVAQSYQLNGARRAAQLIAGLTC